MGQKKYPLNGKDKNWGVSGAQVIKMVSFSCNYMCCLFQSFPCNWTRWEEKNKF